MSFESQFPRRREPGAQTTAKKENVDGECDHRGYFVPVSHKIDWAREKVNGKELIRRIYAEAVLCMNCGHMVEVAHKTIGRY